MKIFSWIAIIVVGLLIIGAGGAWWSRRGDAPASQFQTSPITRGDITASITATGTLEPEEVIDVGAQVAGRIIEFGKDANGNTVDYRSPIEEGTILARIDPVLYQSDVAMPKHN